MLPWPGAAASCLGRGWDLANPQQKVMMPMVKDESLVKIHICLFDADKLDPQHMVEHFTIKLRHHRTGVSTVSVSWAGCGGIANDGPMPKAKARSIGELLERLVPIPGLWHPRPWRADRPTDKWQVAFTPASGTRSTPRRAPRASRTVGSTSAQPTTCLRGSRDTSARKSACPSTSCPRHHGRCGVHRPMLTDVCGAQPSQHTRSVRRNRLAAQTNADMAQVAGQAGSGPHRFGPEHPRLPLKL